MEIQSAFNSGVQGFQQAQKEADQAAADIYSATTFNDSDVVAPQGAGSTSSNDNSQPSLTKSLVDLRVAEQQAKTSAAVIKTADETLGSILDVTV